MMPNTSIRDRINTYKTSIENLKETLKELKDSSDIPEINELEKSRKTEEERGSSIQLTLKIITIALPIILFIAEVVAAVLAIKFETTIFSITPFYYICISIFILLTVFSLFLLLSYIFIKIINSNSKRELEPLKNIDTKLKTLIEKENEKIEEKKKKRIEEEKRLKKEEKKRIEEEKKKIEEKKRIEEEKKKPKISSLSNTNPLKDCYPDINKSPEVKESFNTIIDFIINYKDLKKLTDENLKNFINAQNKITKVSAFCFLNFIITLPKEKKEKLGKIIKQTKKPFSPLFSPVNNKNFQKTQIFFYGLKHFKNKKLKKLLKEHPQTLIEKLENEITNKDKKLNLKLKKFSKDKQTLQKIGKYIKERITQKLPPLKQTKNKKKHKKNLSAFWAKFILEYCI